MRARPLSFVAPSAVAAVAAALLAGVAEAFTSGAGWWTGVSVAAYAAIYSVPAGLVASLLVRALWRSWAPIAGEPGMDGQAAEEAPDAARAAGGLAFAALAILLVAAAGWLASVFAASLTHVPRLAALTVALAAVTAGAIAALVSAPAARALAALARRRAITAAHIPDAAAALAAALSLLLWPVAPYLAVQAVTLIATHRIAARLGAGTRPG
jgi:hypothetical protein